MEPITGNMFNNRRSRGIISKVKDILRLWIDMAANRFELKKIDSWVIFTYTRASQTALRPDFVRV